LVWEQEVGGSNPPAPTEAQRSSAARRRSGAAGASSASAGSLPHACHVHGRHHPDRPRAADALGAPAGNGVPGRREAPALPTPPAPGGPDRLRRSRDPPPGPRALLPVRGGRGVRGETPAGDRCGSSGSPRASRSGRRARCSASCTSTSGCTGTWNGTMDGGCRQRRPAIGSRCGTTAEEGDDGRRARRDRPQRDG